MTRITVMEDGVPDVTFDVLKLETHFTLDQGRGPQGPPGPITGLGNLADLTTDDKSSVIAAINELNMPDVSLISLYNNAKAG